MSRKKKKLKDNNGFLNFRLILDEMAKNLKITKRGSTKFLLFGMLIFPMVFLLFMWMVFGQAHFGYNLAVVVGGYDNQTSLDTAFADNQLNATQQFIDYLNNNSYVGPTVIQTHVQSVGYSEDQFMPQLEHLKIFAIVILPTNFNTIINEALNGSKNVEPLQIQLKCANINEDLLKNIYFGFERKLSAYYQGVFPGEVSVNYTYENVIQDRLTFPRMWTIGSGAIIFAVLVASMIISAALVFYEKKANMIPELALSRRQNQVMNYTGKLLTGTILPMVVNFPITTLIVIFSLGIPGIANMLSYIGIMFLGSLLGSVVGIILSSLIPEQVFTIPASVFILLTCVFLCGGFMDIQIFPAALKNAVIWIPFTYCFSLSQSFLLPGLTWNPYFLLGLIVYIAVFYLIGLKIYQKRVIVG